MLAGEVLELLPLRLDVRHGALEQDRLGAALERGGEGLAKALESVTQLIAAALASAKFWREYKELTHLFTLNAGRPGVAWALLRRGLFLGRLVAGPMVRVTIVRPDVRVCVSQISGNSGNGGGGSRGLDGLGLGLGLRLGGLED